MINYKSDVHGYESHMPEVSLLLAIIERAVNDWDKLNNNFDPFTYYDLKEFLHKDTEGDLHDNMSLHAICHQIGFEYLIEMVRRRCPLSDYNLGMREKEPIACCTCCAEKKKATEMYTYFSGVKKKHVVSTICKACKEKFPSKISRRKEKKRLYIEALREGLGIEESRERARISNPALANWRRTDKEFRRLEKATRLNMKI